MGVDIVFIISSLEGSLSFIVGGERGKVCVVSNVDEDVGTDFGDKLAQPIKAIVPMIRVSVTIRYDKVCFILLRND